MQVKAIVGSELERWLPQRIPFLMLDRINDYVLDDWAVGSKNVCKSEPLLLPAECKEWPGAFVIESLGQLGIALINLKYSDASPPKILLGSISSTRFHSSIPMGCKLDFFIKVEKYVPGDSFILSGYADVGGVRKLTMDSLVAKIVSN